MELLRTVTRNMQIALIFVGFTACLLMVKTQSCMIVVVSSIIPTSGGGTVFGPFSNLVLLATWIGPVRKICFWIARKTRVATCFVCQPWLSILDL